MMVAMLDRLLEAKEEFASLAQRDFDTERIRCRMAAWHSRTSDRYPCALLIVKLNGLNEL
jgi:hypothetical protein